MVNPDLSRNSATEFLDQMTNAVPAIIPVKVNKEEKRDTANNWKWTENLHKLQVNHKNNSDAIQDNKNRTLCKVNGTEWGPSQAASVT